MVVYGILTTCSKEIPVCIMKDDLHYSGVELFKSIFLSLSLSYKKVMFGRIPLSRGLIIYYSVTFA